MEIGARHSETSTASICMKCCEPSINFYKRNGPLSHRASFLGMVDIPRIDFATRVVQIGQLPAVAPGDLAPLARCRSPLNSFRDAPPTGLSYPPTTEPLM